MIEKVVIHNFKSFDHFELDLDKELNILVGNNESGKSTILEAICLALTRKLNGRYLDQVSPHLFNKKIAATFLDDLKSGKNPRLPEIFIEIYLSDGPGLGSLKGLNNSLHLDAIGVRLAINFNNDFKEEYQNLVKENAELKLIPAEYYEVNWRSFAETGLSFRSMPIGLSFIDASAIRLLSGTDYYFQDIFISLDIKDQVALSIAYRKLKEEFAGQQSIIDINKKLDDKKGEITDKELRIAMDVSQKSSWETNVVPHLDDLPLQFSGGGEQSSIKIMLALAKEAQKTNIVLIEEPENHLSFSWMNKLIKKIRGRALGKQIIISTHSSFVLNKLGLEKLVLVSNGKNMRLTGLTKETQEYFKKLSGYDTLRLILAEKAILVEGPSDELMVQRAFYQAQGCLPIDKGIDVINVRGISFKRYLEITKILGLTTFVVTDNDGDYEKKIKDKYRDFFGDPNIRILADSDNSAPTLEPQIVKNNDPSLLNEIFGTKNLTASQLIEYMTINKTECALRLFETEKKFTMPQYIQDACAE